MMTKTVKQLSNFIFYCLILTYSISVCHAQKIPIDSLVLIKGQFWFETNRSHFVADFSNTGCDEYIREPGLIKVFSDSVQLTGRYKTGFFSFINGLADIPLKKRLKEDEIEYRYENELIEKLQAVEPVTKEFYYNELLASPLPCFADGLYMYSVYNLVLKCKYIGKKKIVIPFFEKNKKQLKIKDSYIYVEVHVYKILDLIHSH